MYGIDAKQLLVAEQFDPSNFLARLNDNTTPINRYLGVIEAVKWKEMKRERQTARGEGQSRGKVLV